MRRRPYLFELILAVNAGLVFWKTYDSLPMTLAQCLIGVSGTAAVMTIIAILIRMIVARVDGDLRHYLRILRSRGWLCDSLRLFVAMTLLGAAYTWIKLLVPVFHPVLYDQQLFDLDRVLCFGVAPTVFLLNLFSNPTFLHFVDLTYASFFVGGMFLSFGIFFSSPSRRTRMTFITSMVFLWIGGAWLYMLVPSIGPAYRFPDIWMPYHADLPMTQALQARLIRNYHAVIDLAHGRDAKVAFTLGVAAFPSLHVGMQTLVTLWLRRVWQPGQVIYGFAAFFVFIGSMITGWHYLIDGVAGFALAIASYWFAQWIAKKEFRPL